MKYSKLLILILAVFLVSCASEKAPEKPVSETHSKTCVMDCGFDTFFSLNDIPMEQENFSTTFSELLDLPGGGAIIDTPGVKAFGTIDFERAEVAHYFPEIFKVSSDCRFNNCTHTHEPGCAVRDAVENGDISISRYTSYLSILDEDPNNKYRKPF